MNFNILVTSDIHGYIEPTNYVQAKEDMPFGLERVATCLKEQQDKLKNVITIDDGDFLEGSPVAYYIAQIKQQNSPKQIDHAFNSINYDFGILGNHEFNYGQDYLKNSIKEDKRQILCANITNKDGNHPFGAPYAIKNINGIKVGILGLTTQGTTKWEDAKHLKGLYFNSAVKTAKKYIPIINKQADITLIAYHGGFERDKQGNPTEELLGENESYQLLKEVNGIDALITGHQHRKLYGSLFNTPIIQVGHRGEYVGKITLKVELINGKYQVINGDSKLIPTKNYPTNNKITQDFKPLQNEVNNWLNKPLAKINGSLEFNNAFEVRKHKCSFIEFIQKVQLDAIGHGADISATALFNNEAHGFENPITMRNIITNYIYPNKLTLLEITGADLKAAIEQSAQYFTLKDNQITINKNYIYPKLRHYNYDMYEGINYIINVAKPIGHRVTKLEYHGKPIQSNQKLKIVLNQYRAIGGGHFDMYKNHKVIAKNSTLMSQLIANYLIKHPIINATNDHNFKVINKK